MRKLLFACLIASLGSAAVAAETSTTQSPPDPAVSAQAQGSGANADAKAQPAAEKKKICKNVDAGFSHRTERVCMTAEQWDEYNRGE